MRENARARTRAKKRGGARQREEARARKGERASERERDLATTLEISHLLGLLLARVRHVDRQQLDVTGHRQVPERHPDLLPSVDRVQSEVGLLFNLRGDCIVFVFSVLLACLCAHLVTQYYS